MDDSLMGWDSLAAWYDRKQGEAGDLWHRSLIDPVLIKLIGSVDDRDLLDLGCGNGYLSRKFAREGARVFCVDASPSMIECAKKHDPDGKLGIKYLVSSASNLESLKDGSFDIVFANMTLMDFENAEGAVNETSRVLRKGGRFVASLSHPCFDNGKNSAWIMERVLTDNSFERRLYRRIRAYRQSSSEQFPWVISKVQKGFTRGYHRPLNWYARVFKSAGMAITALEEPDPTNEFLENESEGEWFLEVPLHVVFEVLKL
jgi:ubiquinone/menaquinone biosynthesis C-methylase UbiE